MARTLAGVRLLALLWSLILLSACGGGGGPTTPSGQQLTGTLNIDIRQLAGEQNSAIIPITLAVPRTNAVDAIPVRLRIGWRRTAVPTDPQRLMTSAPGSLDLNNRDTIIDIPVEGREVTFFWDALADLGPDWNPTDEITIRAGILAANANDPRQAVCDFEPIIRVGFGGSGIGCETPIPQVDETTTPTSTVGEPFSFQLETTGGEPPLAFQVLDPVSGNNTGTPDVGFGLFLNSATGEISGIPTADAPEQISFFLRVVDSCGDDNSGQRAVAQFVPAGGRFDQARVTIPVQGGIAPVCETAPSISTTGLPNAALDTPYEFQLEATGGEGTLSWSAEITPSTTDFAVDGNGLITGVPTAPDTYTIALSVTDSCDSIQSDTAELTLVVPCGEGPTFNSPATLPTASIGTLYDHSFNVDMPNGPGTVVFDSGAIPEGIILTPVLDELNRRVVVRLRGTPSEPDDAGQNFVFTLRATDNCPEGAFSDTQGFTLPVTDPTLCPEPTPQLTSPTGTSDLPTGAAGEPYSATLVVSGGTLPVGPVTIISGEPAGFFIDKDGRTLTGTLPASGPSSYDITLQIQDSCETARTDRETFTLDVAAGCPSIGITTNTLPNATNLAPYSFQLQASGGFGSQTWALTGASESLPGGMTLGTDGLLSGTPDDAVRTYNLDIEVRDTCPAGAQITTKALTLTLVNPACPLPTIEPPDVNDPTFDVPFSLQLVAANGVAPYSWEVTSGRFPTGIDIDANGLISGTPNVVSEISVPFSATVTVTDSCTDEPGTASVDIDLTVRPPGCSTLQITTANLPNPVFSAPYATAVEALGELPISFAIISGTLPTGISMSPAGLFTGSATNPSDIGVDFPFTVEATDSCLGGAQTETATFEITVTTTVTCDPIAILNKGFPDPVVNDPYSESLSADGVAPFTWSLTAGTLPTGLSINAAGLLEGTPTDETQSGDEFTFTVGVSDSCALGAQSTSAEYTITLQPELACSALDITTAGLPNANWGQLYSTGLTATGEPPLNWSVIAGNLPTGLTLNAAGLITGTPTDGSEIGTSFDFTVEVMDSCVLDPQFAEADFTIILDGPNCSPLSFGPATIPDPSFGQLYDIPLVPVGGVIPLTWSLGDEGEPPAGITVSADGRITGVPSDPGQIDQEFTFSVQVQDSCPLGVQTASLSYTVILQPEACEGLSILTDGLPGAINGQDYSFQMDATGGKDPLSWSALGLPAGLVMTTDGLISGIPNDETDTYNIEFTVSDDCNPSQVDIVNLDLDLSDPVCPTVTITTSELNNPVLGQPYSDLLEATGGAEPYSWSVISGGLPTGITLASNGSLGGLATVPEEVGTEFEFTVEVLDTCPNGPASATATFAITLNPAAGCGPVSVDTTIIENPFYLQSYSAQLEASGGQAPYNWSLVDGGLPDGMSLSSDGRITGMPIDQEDIDVDFNLEVEVIDSCPFTQGTDTGFITFTVEGPTCAPIGIENEVFPDPQFNEQYSEPLIGSGEADFTWSLVGGELPTGLQVDPDGDLFGIPSDIEQVNTLFNFTLEVTDECVLGAQSTTADFSFRLLPAPSCGQTLIETTVIPDPAWQVPYNTGLQATDGQFPYTWDITSGELPDGLTLNSGGTISGTITDNSLIGFTFDFTVRATDSCPFNSSFDEQDLSITVTGPTCDPIGIGNEFFPDPQLGQSYNATLFGTGEPSLTWSLDDGSLPTGMTVNPTGSISGTPIDPFQVGTPFNFTLRVTDECVFGPQTTIANFSFTLNAAQSCGEVSLLAQDLPVADWNVEYPGATIEAEGGLPPYSFAITGGNLPDGLFMGTDGQINGIVTDPTLIGQSFEFTVEATDTCPFNPGIGSALFTIRVTGPECDPIGIENEVFPDPQLGQEYNEALVGSGTGELTWSLDDGSLPTGMSVLSTGTMVGTPTDPQEVGRPFNFTLRVSDECQQGVQTTLANFSFTLNGPPSCGEIVIEQSDVPDAIFNTDYDFQLTATGGQAPYFWAMIDGDLPPGLNLSTAGRISGVITDPQWIDTEWFPTIEVVDSCLFNPGSAILNATLDVLSNCSPVSILNTGFQNPQLGAEYSEDLVGSGGQQPYTWTLGAGELPIGMSINPEGFLEGTPTSPDQVDTDFTFQIILRDSCPGNQQSTNRSYNFTLRPAQPCDPAPVINMERFPDAFVGTPYSVNVVTTGGIAPRHFNLIGGSLPPGLTLSDSGLVSGTVTDPGLANSEWFPDVEVTDSCPFNPGRDNKRLPLDVFGPNCPNLGITTTGLLNPYFAVPYAAQINTSGGTPAFTWSIIDGELPTGLVLGQDGRITGTATDARQIGSDFPFTVRVEDSCFIPKVAFANLFVNLQPTPTCPTLGFNNTGFPSPFYFAPYTGGGLNITGGTQPYFAELTGGFLPEGMSLLPPVIGGPGWRIGGTPNKPSDIGQTFNFTIRVFDSCEFGPAEVTRSFQFTMEGPSCGTATVTNLSPPDPTFGVPYTFQCTASGGRPPYTWTLFFGSLPAGLSLTSDGRITGTPTDPGQIDDTFSYWVKPHDVCGTFGTPKMFRMTLRD